VSFSESKYLLDLWDRNVCPWCGRTIPEGTRVGSGRRSEGGFCSLSCYANYHSATLEDRARRVQELSAQSPETKPEEDD
jgi:hypothetical protein